MKTLELQPAIRHFEDFAPKDGTADLFDKVRDLDDYLREHPQPCMEALGFHLAGPAARDVRLRDSAQREYRAVMLGSNSYLDLTTHPDVVRASKEACDRFGFGMGAVSLYAGASVLHRQLERLIAEFYETEDAILFPCGYSGNVGVLSALCGPGDVVINDAANHASIFDGAVLSRAELKVYLHLNMRHLEKILQRLPDSQRGRLVVTDGVFSMDGDVAPLDEIADLARRYRARVMVDEAHALGVIGPTGRGTAELRGCLGKVDITYGTLSKAPGAVGGYCAGSAALIRYLRLYARTYFFSTSLPAPTVAGLIEVFKLLMEDRAGRDRLWANIRYLVDGLKRLGFDTRHTESGIVPVVVGDEDLLGRFHRDLLLRGVYTNVVTYPAVRRKECRLRVSVMNSLTREDLDFVLGVFAEVGRAHGLIG